jgi:hypothetical protein
VQVPLVPSAAAAAEDGGLSASALSERFQKALLAITPRQEAGESDGSALPPIVAAGFLLAAHHPAVRHACSDARAIW